MFQSFLSKMLCFLDDITVKEAQGRCEALANGDIMMAENLRFWPGEEANDARFAMLSSLGDLFIQDAFSASHRAHASTEG